MNIYKVVFNIDANYGLICFDEDKNEVFVEYEDKEVANKIKEWLETEHIINTYNGTDDLCDFTEKKILATNSKKDFQTVLTRIWENTGVHIDWSVPPEHV